MIKEKIAEWLGIKPQVIIKEAKRIIERNLREKETGPGFRSSSYGWDNRDMLPTDYVSLHKEVWRLWCTSPLAEQYINLITNHILGNGMVVKFDNKRVQTLFDDFWNDPENGFGIKYLKGAHIGKRLFSLCQELFLYGEQYIAFFDNDLVKYPLIAQIDPLIIEKVVTDPKNYERELAYVLTRPAGANKHRTYLNINASMEDLLAAFPNGVISYTAINKGTNYNIRDLDIMSSAKVLHTAINSVSNQTRGRSILASKVDWIDAVEDSLFDTKRRIQFLSAFVWDVELEGASEDEVEDRALFIKENPPKPGTVRVHNEHEKWAAVTPNLNESSMTKDLRQLKLHCIQGFPEHWFAEGGNANRATAVAMGDPAIRMLAALQHQFNFLISSIISYVIEGAAKKGHFGKSYAEKLNYILQMPDISTVDNKDVATAAFQFSQAMEKAIANNYIDREDANKLMARILGEELDLPEEDKTPEVPVVVAPPVDNTKPVDKGGSGK